MQCVYEKHQTKLFRERWFISLNVSFCQPVYLIKVMSAMSIIKTFCVVHWILNIVKYIYQLKKQVLNDRFVGNIFLAHLVLIRVLLLEEWCSKASFVFVYFVADYVVSRSALNWWRPLFSLVWIRCSLVDTDCTYTVGGCGMVGRFSIEPDSLCLLCITYWTSDWLFHFDMYISLNKSVSNLKACSCLVAVTSVHILQGFFKVTSLTLGQLCHLKIV